MSKQKVLKKKQVTEACKAYFNGDALASDVVRDKYLMRQPGGDWLEKTPDDKHQRMAAEFHRNRQKYSGLRGSLPAEKKGALSDYGKSRKELSKEDFFNYFKDYRSIIPQGSVMAMLGNTEVQGAISNCFVLPELYDSYGGITYADQQIAQIAKRRGGIGLSISTLRPSQVSVQNAALTSTGAVSFMERFSNTTREVAQNGRRKN